jgi:MFS family permease
MNRAATRNGEAQSEIQLGIRPNLSQFLLLIVINAFVGGMVGLERTVVPLLGKQQFHINSTSLITSFIVSFGVTKALIDLLSGQLADHWGRKPILVLGWLAGLPVPFLLIYAPDWSWIIAARSRWSSAARLGDGTERIRRLRRGRAYGSDNWIHCRFLGTAA